MGLIQNRRALRRPNPLRSQIAPHTLKDHLIQPTVIRRTTTANSRCDHNFDPPKQTPEGSNPATGPSGRRSIASASRSDGNRSAAATAGRLGQVRRHAARVDAIARPSPRLPRAARLAPQRHLPRTGRPSRCSSPNVAPRARSGGISRTLLARRCRPPSRRSASHQNGTATPRHHHQPRRTRHRCRLSRALPTTWRSLQPAGRWSLRVIAERTPTATQESVPTPTVTASHYLTLGSRGDRNRAFSVAGQAVNGCVHGRVLPVNAPDDAPQLVLSAPLSISIGISLGTFSKS